MTKPDILERLVDFDRWGLTATERFEMRMEAYNEIKRLRVEVRRARESVERFCGLASRAALHG